MIINCRYQVRALLVILFVSGMISSNSYAVTKGETCPEFKAKTDNSETIEINKFKGKVIYLDFWASWCAPCKKSLPWMNELQKKYSGKNFQIIAVNLDSQKEDAEKLLKTLGVVNFKLLFDSSLELPNKFNVLNMPTSYLIDQSGKIYEVFSGFDDSEKEKIESGINNLLSGEN